MNVAYLAYFLIKSTALYLFASKAMQQNCNISLYLFTYSNGDIRTLKCRITFRNVHERTAWYSFGDDAMQQNNLPSTKFYRLPQVREIAGGVAPSTIWAWVKNGTFPKPVKLSPNCTAWPADVVEQWAQDRIAASRKDSQSGVE